MEKVICNSREGEKSSNFVLAATAFLAVAASITLPASGAVSYVVDAKEGPEKAKWADDVLALADPFIGSGGTGHTTPAAAYPFGMVQPGPDTSHAGWEHCSAYQYGDKRIRRFSQNHLSGTGCSEFTDVAFMPAAGDPDVALKRDYTARFDKATEKASPGYYAVTLACGTKVEATCTRHVSFFRFTFPKDKRASLLFDPSWSFSKVKSAEITPMKERRISGHVDRHGWPGHEYWFAWEISTEPLRGRIVKEAKAEKGSVPVYAYEFDVGMGNVIYLKVSLSRTSAEGARRNIEMEVPGWDFDGVLASNRAAWRGILERVKAKGTKDQLKALYTSIYHLCFQPNTISDVGEPDLYSTFSCWDTYRAAGPLYTILTPEYVPAFINSMLWHFDQNGHLPVWTLWGKDNQCMIGAHSVPMIVDAYLKGLGKRGKGNGERGTGNGERVDWEKAWRCVEKTLTENRGRHKAKYELIEKYGYYPCDVVKDESVSRLLEDCYDQACAARFAKALGKEREAKFFRDRSLNWTNVFDKTTGFMRGRDSKGVWRKDFDPYKISHITHCDYTEGNAYHWNWHVMQDPDLLVGLLGGRDAAARRLEKLFTDNSKKGLDAIPDVTGLIGQYCHGNEPSHHNIYFFSLLGRRDLAARYVRKVMDTQYQTTPTGLCGNDDCGQMSAWYIFSAMGLYPFDPCGGNYVLGEAQMEEISIDVGGGNRFRVVSELPGEVSASVELNGRKLDGVTISHNDIMKGATLGFVGGISEYDYVFDTSGAPELAAWTKQNIVHVVREWYPKLVEMFPSEGWSPYKEVRFRFRNEKNYPAYASGRCVTMSRDWFAKNPEDLGCIIHELFHVVQGGYRNAPDWLTEGIADYVRFYLFEPESHGCDMVLRSADARYDGKYRVSANFLDFVERRYPGVVKELNALCRQGKYDEAAYWAKRTGKTVKELETEWKSQGNGPFKHYRFCVDGTKAPAYCTQLSEIELLDAEGKVISRSAFELGFEAGDGAFGNGETPDKAVDGDVATKWLDFRADSNAPATRRASVWLQFKFAKPVKLSGYRWYTANDFVERDPAAWRLLGSNDGTNWIVIDKVEGFRAISDRNKLTFSRRLTKSAKSARRSN